jgi:hypothetical protein
MCSSHRSRSGCTCLLECLQCITELGGQCRLQYRKPDAIYFHYRNETVSRLTRPRQQRVVMMAVDAETQKLLDAAAKARAEANEMEVQNMQNILYLQLHCVFANANTAALP